MIFSMSEKAPAVGMIIRLKNEHICGKNGINGKRSKINVKIRSAVTGNDSKNVAGTDANEISPNTSAEYNINPRLAMIPTINAEIPHFNNRKNSGESLLFSRNDCNIPSKAGEKMRMEPAARKDIQTDISKTAYGVAVRIKARIKQSAVKGSY